MKICVFGAGAIGGNVAARLASGGAEVSVVARGEHLNAIRENGLTLELPDRTINQKVRASADPKELGPQDLAIVAVKAPSLPEVAAGIGPLLKADTPVMFVMNGIPWWYFYQHGGKFDGRRLPLIDPNDAVWNAVGPDRAIGAVIYSANSVPRPGVINNVGGGAALTIGEPSGELSARTRQIADALIAGGAKCDVTSNMREAVWGKLLGNMSSNPLCFLSECSIGEVVKSPLLFEKLDMMAKEAAAIAKAQGYDVSLDVQKAFGGGTPHKPSIVQDLIRRKPLELDAMFTVPLELGKLFGVETPMLDMLVALMKLRAKAAGLYDN
jgi:2-dehydropantoate 2-reductase